LAPLGSVGVLGYAYVRDISHTNEIKEIEDEVKELETERVAEMATGVANLCTTVTSLLSAVASGSPLTDSTSYTTIASPNRNEKVRAYVNRILEISDPTCAGA